MVGQQGYARARQCRSVRFARRSVERSTVLRAIGRWPWASWFGKLTAAIAAIRRVARESSKPECLADAKRPSGTLGVDPAPHSFGLTASTAPKPVPCGVGHDGSRHHDCPQDPHGCKHPQLWCSDDHCYDNDRVGHPACDCASPNELPISPYGLGCGCRVLLK